VGQKRRGQIPIKVIQRSLHRRGYGAVVRYGTAYGTGRYCIFVSADNVDPVHLIPQMYKEMENGAILAQCSRYIRVGDDSTIPFSYKFYQFFFRIGVRIAIGYSIPDSTYAFKMFRRRELLGVGQFAASTSALVTFCRSDRGQRIVCAGRPGRATGREIQVHFPQGRPGLRVLPDPRFLPPP
jgi:glycosyltransferase involved in cell wall biosynthesis